MRLPLIFTIIFCLLLSACMMVGPNYKEPKKLISQHWEKQNNTIKETPIKDAQWWTVFHDATLTALIHQGYEHNLTLHMAGVHVLQARAQLAQSVGELYPQQQALTGNLTYQRIGGTSLQTLLPNNFETAILGPTASWELDFWGKYRRAILSNDAVFLASYAAYDNALISLTADIAIAYINIRTTEKLIRITKQNIAIQQMGYDIAKTRFNAGQVSLLDVEQAETELTQTQSTLPQFVSELQTQKDTLAVLLGTTPHCIEPLLKGKQGIPKSPTTVAVGIPRETIIKRPDIYQARMEAVAQSELIGATKANLFPSFSLTGSFSFASSSIPPSSLNEIFNWSNRTIAAGPAVNWSILNYGQITNAVRAQDAAFQQSILKYLNLVLKAQAEVQDQITAFIETNKSEHCLVKANNAAVKSTELAMIRYREGESDYTPVLDAERQMLSVQTSLTNAQGNIPKTLVALYRALGGGWQIRHHNDIVPKQILHEMAVRTNWGSLLKQENHEPPKTQPQQTKDIYLPNW